MDTVGHRLVLALASRLFYIFDVRKMDAPEQTRESSLKFLTRALACMSDGQGTFLPPGPSIGSFRTSRSHLLTLFCQVTRPPPLKAASP
jgi:hypothetical protein